MAAGRAESCVCVYVRERVLSIMGGCVGSGVYPCGVRNAEARLATCWDGVQRSRIFISTMRRRTAAESRQSRPPGSRALHPRTTAESTMNVAEGLAFGRQEQWTCYKYRAVSEESARKQWVNRGRAGRRRQYPRAHRDRLCSRPASPPICKADPKELTRWVRRVFRE
jgi:hypothetical protein